MWPRMFAAANRMKATVTASGATAMAAAEGAKTRTVAGACM